MATPKNQPFAKQFGTRNMSTPAIEKKSDGSEQLSFGVSPSNFPALSADAKAVSLFNACADSFIWGAKVAPESAENPPQIQGDWTFPEGELIRAAAREGAATKNAGTAGKFQSQLSPQQQIEFANSYGVAIAQAMDDALAGRAPISAYGAGTTSDPMLDEKLGSIYVAAYHVYGTGGEYAGEGGLTDQETASNLGRNLLIGLGIAAVLAGGLYWMSKKQARANPSDMQLYQLNDEQESITLEEFLADNAELGSEEVEKIKSLGVEETFHGGGGAQPEWKIRRVY